MSLAEINANLERWKAEKMAGVYGVATNVSSKAERSAKRFASWNDQTGNARQGLNSRVDQEDNNIYITLAHRVDYGPYLELANDKKYEILRPTLNRFRGSLYRWVKRIMES